MFRAGIPGYRRLFRPARSLATRRCWCRYTLTAVTMRTVLAVDDLMARAVAKKLTGEIETCGRVRMRLEGDNVVRDLVLRSPCVLVIGAKEWDPLDLLEQWRLPYEVPVVLVLPKIDWESTIRATRVDAFSVLSIADLKRKLPTSIVAECQIAEAWRQGRLSRPDAPVVVQRTSRASRGRAGLARVYQLPPPSSDVPGSDPESA